MNGNFTFTPVGIYHSAARWKSEAPRQAVFASMPGVIEFSNDPRFLPALSDLQGFERIWILFVFDRNESGIWNAKVSPPLSPEGTRFGVFATRSPHRPNPIGLTCAELDTVDGNLLKIRAADLLDGTPVLDIKPYIPEIDAFPTSAAGWRDRLNKPEWTVVFSPGSAARAAWLRTHGGPDLENVCRVQLSFEPMNRKKKRLSRSEDILFFHFRTWRLAFETDETGHIVQIVSLESNYSKEELADGAPDPYGDKDLHRTFLRENGDFSR